MSKPVRAHLTGDRAKRAAAKMARATEQVEPITKARDAGDERPTSGKGLASKSVRQRERDLWYQEWSGAVKLAHARGPHNGRCMAGNVLFHATLGGHGCRGHAKAVWLHHLRKVGPGADAGGDLMSRANVMPICEDCHKWIHADDAMEDLAYRYELLIGPHHSKWAWLGAEP